MIMCLISERNCLCSNNSIAFVQDFHWVADCAGTMLPLFGVIAFTGNEEWKQCEEQYMIATL